MKLFIIHPGIQHSPRLANGAVRSGLFEKVILCTSILFQPHQKVIGLLKKRAKPIDKEIHIVNHYLYTFLFTISRYLYNKVFVNPQNQSHNNPIYFWQQVFGLLCLPRLYVQRKNTLVVCFETTGWPIVKYCKRWGIPVIMDFASISHEKAKTLGINETAYGISLKVKERALIDYGFYCSEFCRKSFEGLTSAKKDFVLYLGADRSSEYRVVSSETCGVVKGIEYSVLSSESSSVGSVEEKQRIRESAEPRMKNKENSSFRSETLTNEFPTPNQLKIKLSFIANLEYRKGLDIFLESIYAYEYPVSLEVHLIGRIRENWVVEHMPKKIINHQIKLVYQPAMSQGELFDYLAQEQFDLNVQCSRFDSFAMVVPETMMQGIPNVVSPFVGAGEMINNGVDGFIMKELGSKSLNEIINRYMKLSDSEKVKLKENVFAHSKNMVWDNYYENLAVAFKEVLADIK